MNEAIEWYRQATVKERWKFLDAIGGDCVAEDTCYVHPNQELEE